MTNEAQSAKVIPLDEHRQSRGFEAAATSTNVVPINRAAPNNIDDRKLKWLCGLIDSQSIRRNRERQKKAEELVAKYTLSQVWAFVDQASLLLLIQNPYFWIVIRHRALQVARPRENKTK